MIIRNRKMCKAFDNTIFTGKDCETDCLKYENHYNDSIVKALVGHAIILKIDNSRIVVKFFENNQDSIDLINKWLCINNIYDINSEKYTPIHIEKEDIVLNEWMIIYPVGDRCYRLHITMEAMIENIQNEINRLNSLVKNNEV